MLGISAKSHNFVVAAGNIPKFKRINTNNKLN